MHLKTGYERERWSVYGWVRNVFDKNYAVRGFFFENEPPDWEKKLYIQQGDPRQYRPHREPAILMRRHGRQLARTCVGGAEAAPAHGSGSPMSRA